MSSAHALDAQEKTLPPTSVTDALATPVTTTTLSTEMPYASDRAVIAPNMFGTVLGTRWFFATGPNLGPNFIPGVDGASIASKRTVSGILRDSLPSDASFEGVIGTTQLDLLSTDLNFNGVKLTNSDYTSTIVIVAPGQKTLPIFEVPAHTAAIAAALGKPGETVVFNAAASQAQLSTSPSTFPIYHIFLVYDFITNKTVQAIIVVPNPADGGLAGRNRVSTDASPLPRDRFIFNYDFVSNTNLYTSTPTMNRLVFGFEKTFFDGIASVEFRVPFASTVSSTSHSDGVFGSGNGEFGNLFLVLKSLLYTDNTCVFSGGLGLSLPTADDVRLQFGGPDVLKIRNEAVILTPFIAGLWTPTDRLFSQTWLGFSFDTNGNPAQTDLDGAGLKTKGRLYDPSTVQVDWQLGFWLVHPATSTGTLRGLAPFVELHYNQELQPQNVVTDGIFTIASGFGQLSEFNASTGFAAQLGENVNLMLGATFPLTGAEDRFIDWQVGLRLNYFFGPTGRARINAFN